MRAGDVAARRHIHDTSRRTRAIIPLVDRSNNSSFYIIAFGAVNCWSVHHFERAWSADTNRIKPFLCPTLRKNILQEELLYAECVDYNFVG